MDKDVPLYNRVKQNVIIGLENEPKLVRLVMVPLQERLGIYT